jgi:hypothetical protein
LSSSLFLALLDVWPHLSSLPLEHVIVVVFN